MDVIIPAGGIPKPGHLLYPFTQGKPKALINIAGKPMIQWVLDAVSEAKSVGRVAVVGLDRGVELSCIKPLTLLPNQGSMIGNIRAGIESILEKNPNAEYVMTVASDIPLVTGKILDWFIAQTQMTHHELYMNMVTRQALETRFPGVKRRVDRVGNLELRGVADVSIFYPTIVMQKYGAADRFENARGNTWRQVNFIGFDTLLLLALRRLDLDSFTKRLSKKHGIDLHPIICPFAEIAMDVDDPLHLEIMRRELSAN
ncbi:MAG TPA: NTP transferase domain-containing protein [Anaerolineales bacterium]|nr:NTP transferase domain-containing protein [Anaerolineales bacterium]